MNNINEIIVPDIPELSLSINSFVTDTKDYSLRGSHFHKELEIFRIDEGSMLFCADKIKLDVHKGNIIFINPFCIHEFKVNSNKCKATYFQIDLQPYINEFFNTEDYILFNFIHNQYSDKFKIFSSDKINDIINSIENEITKKEDFYDVQVKSYIYQLIVHLLRYNLVPNHKKLYNKSVDKLLPVINYINDNIDKKLTLNELCDLLHIDKYYFCKLFKQAMVSTLTEYVNFTRMHKAEQLLINQNKSISEIALECGFSSPQYFNKLFKKINGVSPSYYKKLFSKS